MRKLALLLLICAVAAVACLPVAPPAPNQPPIAYIDSISPTEASPGQTVTFQGHGIDPDSVDGKVVAYQWRSSRDGELSTSSGFKTASLSEGTHTIWFRVQDRLGEWSGAVSANITVFSSGLAVPVVNTFEARPGSITLGGTSTLVWNVSGATSATIYPGIGNVAVSGSRVVNPRQTVVYTLTAYNEAGSVSATSEIAVAPTSISMVELFSVVSEDGFVRRDGLVGPEPDAGDTEADLSMQAFLSFDISMIPQNAIIRSASLDLSKAGMVGGPFITLGMLRIYNHQYAELDSSDYVSGIPSNFLFMVSRVPGTPLSSSRLNEAIETQVRAGSSRFQIRAQFDKYVYFNREANYIVFGEGEPRLVIEYETVS